MARTLLSPRTSSGNSARPKSASSQNYPSHSASSRSSKLERTGSRFFDRFTFFSVSVTEYPFFPSGFRPAPFRFPPRFERILPFRIDITLIIYHSFNQARKNYMANKRLSKEKQTLVLMALCEGMPIRACARMYKVGKNTIHRLICETGEAFADYMDKELRDLSCLRIEMDEQWQYVGCHAGRMVNRKDPKRGDFWLWAAIDADTKLVLSHRVGKRDWVTGNLFVKDVSERVSGPVQIATDQLPAYAGHIRMHFGYEGYSYGTETKVFGEPHLPDGTLARLGHNEGVRKMQTVEREAVVGSPDLESLTTSHIERAFLTVRQELKRFQRKGLGYSKDLETHKHAVALHFGVYNFVRRHHTLGTTPAVAAGIEEKAWGLERVVDITAAYMARKKAEQTEKAEAGAGI